MCPVFVPTFFNEEAKNGHWQNLYSMFITGLVLHKFFKDFMYLFLERGEEKEKERERKKYQCMVASCTTPRWGPGPQSRHVP